MLFYFIQFNREESIRHKKNSTIVFVISIAATIGVMLSVYFVYRRNTTGKIILLFTFIKIISE